MQFQRYCLKDVNQLGLCSTTFKQKFLYINHLQEKFMLHFVHSFYPSNSTLQNVIDKLINVYSKTLKEKERKNDVIINILQNKQIFIYKYLYNTELSTITIDTVTIDLQSDDTCFAPVCTCDSEHFNPSIVTIGTKLYGHEMSSASETNLC